MHNKKYFLHLFHQLIDPLKPHYSPGNALLDLGHTGTVYSDHITRMEAFARPLWGFAPYLAGGRRDAGLEATYLKGLQSGTDPSHPEYWDGFHDYDQRFVEMAAIATALLMAPEYLWHPLSADAKANLAEWLNGINHYECVPNNWQFFCVLVNTALRALDMPYDPIRMETSLNAVDSYYIDGGWYHDGAEGQTDYYIGFAIHFYSLIYAKFMHEADPVRSETYRERAKAFAQDFIYWFDASGPSVAYGRSQTYRFAQTAFFSACVWAGVDAFPLPVMKGIIVRHLNSWMEAPMFDQNGLITLGYRYPNLQMCEEYNGPGSPYWCMKSFILLALEDDHPFWAAEAAPLPELDPVKKFKNIPMFAQRIGEQAVLYPCGNLREYKHNHMDSKYSKFAYASQMGFHISISNLKLSEASPDNMLTFEWDGKYFTRNITEEYSITDTSMHTRWSPLDGISVTTAITPVENGHIREHLIKSSVDCTVYDSGFSVPQQNDEPIASACDNRSAAAANRTWKSSISTEADDGDGIIINAAPNTNLLEPRASIPSIRFSVKKGTTRIRTSVELRTQ